MNSNYKKSMYILFPVLLQVLLHPSLLSQDTIRYTVSFSNHVHHEARITLNIGNRDSVDSLFFRMSNASPGRYAPHQFAKNVYELDILNDRGKKLNLTKSAPDRWLVSSNGEPVSFTYTLFADHPDGTYSGISRDHVLLNPPSAFIWSESQKKTPVLIRFIVPAGQKWKIETQLKRTTSPDTFFAPDLDYMMDSPVVMSILQTDTVMFNGKDGASRMIRIIYNPPVNNMTRNSFTDMIGKIIQEQQAVFGELPEFDFGSYSILTNYGEGFFGDGMEHRNSTMITSPMPLPGNETKLIGTVTHEFFHCWNVERIRPKSLEPFNFTGTNMCGELWFAEGFTSYYADLICHRSGIYSLAEFLAEISKPLNYVINLPGQQKGSPEYMSKMAPFVDASVWIDEMNINNVFISYYDYGSAIGLALDLTLRATGRNISLDDLMKRMWEKYGRTEIPYSSEDLKKTLAEVAGDPDLAEKFFQNYIYDNKLPDFESLLGMAGLEMRLKNPDTAWLGFNQVNFDGVSGTILSYPLEGDPLYKAGIEKGDRIIKLDSLFLMSQGDLQEVLEQHLPGDMLSVKFTHLEDTVTSPLILQQNPVLTIQPIAKPSPKEREFRHSWLSSKIGER